MSPSAPAGVPAQLRHLIYYHLDNGYLENALFFAGRLHALEPRSHDAAHLLALCNLKLGRNKAAFDYAKPKGTSHQHLGCAYVFAQACLALERFDAGTTALEKSRGLWATKNHWNKHSDSARIHLPDAAACYCLLGKLWQAHGDTKKAVDNYIESLKLNPCMWDAFTALCDMGTAVRPVNIFKVTPEILASLTTSLSAGQSSHNSMPQEAPDTRNPFVSTPDNDPFNPRTGGDIGLNLGGANLLSRLNGMTNGHGHGSAYPDVDTPTSNAQNVPDNDIMMGDAVGPVMNEGGEMPHAPVRKTRTQAYNATEDPPRMRPITTRTRLKMGSESSESTDIPRPIGQNGHKRTVSGHSTHHSQQSQQSSMAPSDPTAAPPRRSVRLLNHIRPSASRFAGATARDAESKEKRDLKKKATGTKGKTASTSTAGRVVSGNRRPTVDTSEPTSKPDLRPSSSGLMRAPPPRMAAPKELAQGKDSIEWLLDLLRKIGTGYSQLSRYQCVQALEAFATVPTQQRETPWVLAQIGKAQYERCMYSEAEKVFQRVREKAPTSLDGMEVFSNVLWQLKKETDLAYLAHTLLEQDRLSPEAWCALGNSFSLQREHDQAIKCFSRATQLDPEFAYAFTLQGHEHLANEEFDKAMLAYRCAISADNRHYNGWYGLGQVFEKMGKYDVAEKHFRAAAQINPTNPFLAVRIGAVLDRMRKTQPALMQYMAAIALDPRSTVARFRKAEIHLKLGSPLEALKDLEYLKDCIPDDANVHFLLGRTYNMIGERGNAIRHYTIAMNLDPKAQSLIKEAMEKVGEDDGEGWSSDDDR
ncbi:TPR-like protein [Aaosphaeria arxii CBS 175.79]|uniref:TPR-like protein n=1 Tax=Aaosphaeria arxii CBS 175.79 TaxID=1450172 RepID=A0A6A5Y2Q6_9PLEO|nr:TPR-like protein [Aaosphaeria arxii CBS 175.79]KAF2019835.1 TPR-like protein [Aaosphaeria arxii CBS 175.79]